MASLLPILLLVVVCPLVMFFMMRGMHGHGAHGAAADNGATGENLNIAQLRKLREDLETRIDDLDARIEDLETAGSPSTSARS